jgi:hypothetical protein
VAAIAGAVTLAVSALVSILGVDFSDLSKNPGVLISASLPGMLAAVLLLLGLVWLYASQARAAGVLGLVGFLLALLGTVFVAGFDWSGPSSCRTWRPRPPESSRQPLRGLW